MEIFYQLDIASVILSAILLFIVFTRKSYETLRRKLFKGLLTVCLFTSALEILSVFTWTGTWDIEPWLVQIINISNIIVHFFVHIIFVYYIHAVSHDSVGNKAINWIGAIIAILVIAFALTNPIHNLLFSYTPGQPIKFNFGKNIILNGLSTVTIIYSLVIYLRRDEKNKYETTVNLLFFIGIVLSVIFEEIFDKILFENFTITVFLIILTILFDNPNKYFFKNSLVFNEFTFNKIYSRKIKQKIPFKLVAFHYADYDIYIQKIGKVRTDNIVKITAEYCKKDYGNDKVFIFGRDVIVIDIGDKDSIKEANSIAYNCHKTAITKNHELKLNACCALVDYPENMDNITDIHDYIYGVLFNESFDDNSVYKFNPNLLEKMSRQKNILMALHDAIENDGFDVFFQPIYDIKAKKFNSLEALVRLKNRVGDRHVSPGEFIPLAEKTGLIFEIDEIVFEKVCRYVRNNNLSEYGIKFVHVNMSLYKLIYPEVVDRYYELTKRYEIDPSYFNLEITETAEGDEKYLSLVRQNIAKFSEKGFRFSLDDYGSGYSSVIYMAEMDTKIVKIDAAIVWNAIRNKKYFTVLENCVRLIYCFDKDCIAEGIENEDMIKMLSKLGVRYYQGFYYSKPLPGDELLTFLTENNKINRL